MSNLLWPTVTVEEIAAKSDGAVAIGPFGSAMKSDCYVTSGVPVIRGGNLTSGRRFVGDFKYITEDKASSLQRCLVYTDDLVFPHRGAIGEVGIVPDDNRAWMLSTSLMKFTCDLDKAYPLFVYYYFASAEGRAELLQYSSTVGTPGIGQPLTSLKSCKVPVPPLEEQRRIAHVLGTLDDKIELNRQMNATLEAIAQAIFKSWFVDFDGHDDLVESDELGLIPKGWEVGKFTDWIKIDPRLKTLKGKVATYMGMSEMPTSGHRAENWYLKRHTSGKRFQNDDTLMARITPCLENGKTAFVDFLAEDEVGWGSTEYLVMRTQSYLPPEYVYYLCRSEQVRAFAIANMTGTSGRQRVGKPDFEHLHIAVPPEEKAEEFGRLASTLMAKIRANDEVSRTLTELRDTLLPKLISGELRVPEALEIAGEVVGASENEEEGDEVKQLTLGL